jgi:hypothetical protein
MEGYIDLVLGGIASSPNISKKSQLQAALGIDPDMPDGDSDIRPSGVLRPTQMSKFSGTEITGVPLWMVTTQEDTNLYVYTNDGKVHVVTSALAMGTALNSGNALSTSSGNGAAYLKGVILFAKNTHVSHYDIGTATLTQDWWNGVASLTAPINTTYPAINGVNIPNHMIHRHVSSQVEAYMCNVLSTGAGSLNRIVLNDSGTDDGSEANVLDFPFTWYPVTLESHSSYLLIALIEGVSTAVRQKPARLALWDCSSDSYEDVTPENFTDPLITAFKKLADGSILIFSGNATGGCRISQFYGVGAIKQVAYYPDTYPPLQGAVDALGDRVALGGKVTIPSAAGVVHALGSTQPDFAGSMGLNNILKATASGANPHVTALKYFIPSATKPQPVVGWKDDSAKGLDKLATTSNTSITVKFLADDESVSETVATINNTNNSGERSIQLLPKGCRGGHSFALQFEWSNGAVARTGKAVIGKPFALDYLRIPLSQAIAATFVGTIKTPVFWKVSVESD